MLNWRTWLPPSPFKRRIPGNSTTASIPEQASRKVLHGRITKPALPRATPPTGSAILQRLGVRRWIKEESEDDDDSEDKGLLLKDTRVKSEASDEPFASENGINTCSHGESKGDGGYRDCDQEERIPILPIEPTPLGKLSIMKSTKSDSSGGDDIVIKLDEDADADADVDSDTDSHNRWRTDQLFLNTILNARNGFTLMPSTWKMHFRGIPLPDSLFYIQTRPKSIRPRIYARTDKLEYRGAVALRKLIDVHARIRDIRNEERAIRNDTTLTQDAMEEQLNATAAAIVKQLRHVLRQALQWAEKDGGFEKYGHRLPPNVLIVEPDGKQATGTSSSDMKIQMEMSHLAEKWRAFASTLDEPSQPPVIFGFVIIKHIITIVTMDASDPDANVHVPCRLHMAERNQHQWNALAILVTVCWARDVLVNYVEAWSKLLPHEMKESKYSNESSDPDL
ncbi:hypothetical protein GGS20DRAFT_598763 [Poronia punctata]|nr:hypothetical protein GGS20DRAFT_598763 [Poronia punctata]